jgi:Flp pilus assembly protein TadG
MAQLIRKRMATLRKENGAAMVEFAIVLPFLLLIIVGVLEIGIILIQDNTLNKSVRDSARYMVTNWDVSGCYKNIAEKVIKENMNNMFSSTYTDSQFNDGTDTIVIEQVCIDETTGSTIGGSASINADCTSATANYCSTAPGHLHIRASATFQHKMVIPGLLGLSFTPTLTATETMRAQ